MKRLLLIVVCVVAVAVALGLVLYPSVKERAAIEPNAAAVRLPKPLWPSELVQPLSDSAPFPHRLNALLSPAECRHMVEQAMLGFNRSQVVDHDGGGTKFDDVRTSSSSFLKRAQTPIIKRVEERAAAVFGVPVENVEPLQVVRYHPAEKYDAHHDFFHHLSGVEGQRYGTILVYLNDDFEGGTTSFLKCGIEAQPVTGDALFWYNCWRNSDNKCFCFDESLHQGNPTSSGVKYALNVWVRFEPYKS